MARVGVVGTTSWGTTLAILLAQEGHDVRLWARTEEEAQQLREAGENRRFLPGTPFPPGLRVTASPEEALGDASLVLVVVPSRTLRENVRAIAGALDGPSIVVSATKGLEVESGKRMSQLLEEELPPDCTAGVCALSGPNLAREIIEGKPATTVIASSNIDAAAEAQATLGSARFRVYTNSDIVGVEFGGALKNVIAVGAGSIDGLGLGDNAKAAFMTRGLVEIARLAVAAGADPLTLAGLAGMGDLIATCSSPLSRNHYVGEQLAKGKTLDEIMSTMKNVAEGVPTTAGAVNLAKRLDVEMPIASVTYDVLFNNVPVSQAMSDLLGRAPSPEYQ